MNQLSAQVLRDLLSYDPKSGQLSWRFAHGRHGRIPAGPISNRVDSYGYLRIQLDGLPCRAHRVCWMLTHGSWPVGDIDHINGDRTDNRLCNLRDVDESTNMQNQRKPARNNTTGFLGVCLKRQGHPRWVAQLRIKGKTFHIGTFGSPEEAHAAYLAVKRVRHPGCTI